MSSNSTGDGLDGGGPDSAHHDDARRRLKAAFRQIIASPVDPERKVLLPPLQGSLSQAAAQGHTLRTDGTNVIRVPFGVRLSRRPRPQRPERWATVVLPFQSGGSLPPPPQAA